MMKKGIIAIVIAVMMVFVVAFGYDYHQTRLENGAYEYLEEELYGTFSDLNVTEIEKVGNGCYDIHYTYEREDGHTIIGTHYGVTI